LFPVIMYCVKLYAKYNDLIRVTLILNVLPREMRFTLRSSNWLVSDPLSFWRTGDLTPSVSRCVGGSPGDDSLVGVVGALEGCS